MRRRAGQCWGLCSARCASHRPQQGSNCPFGRHARPPPGQAVQHARRSVPPSPPLLSEWGQVGRCSLHERCGSGKATGPRGKKSCGPPAKGNEGNARPRGGECHTGERHARPRQAACGGPCVAISGAAGTKTRARGPCGRTPYAPHTTERKETAMMLSIQVPTPEAALELENALLLNLLDIQRQLEALEGKRTAYAIHRRETLRKRYKLCEEWKQCVVRQSASLFNV